MEPIEVATWGSMNGGSTDMELPLGVYRLEAAEIKVVTGPLDEDFHLVRPTVTVALITRTEGTNLRMVDYKGDGHPVPVYDVDPTETLTPLDAAGFVVGEAGLYRLGWSGKGTVALVKVG